jgi:ribosomal protein S11
MRKIQNFLDSVIYDDLKQHYNWFNMNLLKGLFVLCTRKTKFIYTPSSYRTFIQKYKLPLRKKRCCFSPLMFFLKKDVPTFLTGFSVLFIKKTGKNVFVNWLDSFGRLLLNKSLMTLNDPKKQKTKKQKSFSIYYLLKKFGKTLRKRYKLKAISVVIKGSFGIRRKRSFIAAVSHSGLNVKLIVDITATAFNGCSLRRKKRL